MTSAVPHFRLIPLPASIKHDAFSLQFINNCTLLGCYERQDGARGSRGRAAFGLGMPHSARQDAVIPPNAVAVGEKYCVGCAARA